MRDMIEREKDAWKMIHYSGHDTTIAPLRAILFISDYIIPPCASHLIFELYRDEEASREFFVHVKYNGKSQILPG